MVLSETAIVVAVGWYHHHCLKHTQLNNLMSLAMSLVADLGLNRNTARVVKPRLLALTPEDPMVRTNEERRIFLGVWYLSSCISVDFQRTESLRFSNYVQQCLRELESAQEFETDAFLVKHLQLQHLTERIHNFNCKELEAVADNGATIPRAPDSAYQAAFQGELDRFEASLDKNLKGYSLFPREPDALLPANAISSSPVPVHQADNRPAVRTTPHRRIVCLQAHLDAHLTVPDRAIVPGHVLPMQLGAEGLLRGVAGLAERRVPHCPHDDLLPIPLRHHHAGSLGAPRRPPAAHGP